MSTLVGTGSGAIQSRTSSIFGVRWERKFCSTELTKSLFCILVFSILVLAKTRAIQTMAWFVKALYYREHKFITTVFTRSRFCSNFIMLTSFSYRFIFHNCSGALSIRVATFAGLNYIFRRIIENIFVYMIGNKVSLPSDRLVTPMTEMGARTDGFVQNLTMFSDVSPFGSQWVVRSPYLDIFVGGDHA